MGQRKLRNAKKKRRLENSTGKQVNWKQVSVRTSGATLKASIIHLIKSGGKGGKGPSDCYQYKTRYFINGAFTDPQFPSCQTNNVFFRDGPFSMTMLRHVLHVFRQHDLKEELKFYIEERKVLITNGILTTSVNFYLPFL